MAKTQVYFAIQAIQVIVNEKETRKSIRDRFPIANSVAGIALVFFAFINIALPIYDEIEVRVKESRASAHDVTAGIFKNVIKDVQARAGDGTTMLMGSSVVSLPLWKCDATLAKPGDKPNLQRSFWLERYLTEKNALKDQVLNASLSGAFVSDQFLIVDKLCEGKHKPSLLIYGMVPRDFMDSRLSGFSRTPIFDLLVGAADVFRLSDLLFGNFQEKADFLLAKTVYLFDHRGTFQHKLLARMNIIVASLLDKDATTVSDASEKFDPKNPMAFFKREAVWARSVKEYQYRYRYFNVTQFEKQKEFLNALISLCQQRDIELVLVNMPLTQANIDLMPKDLYKQYHEFLAKAAADRNVSYIDLQGKFPDEEFFDTAHLNDSGGGKLLTMFGDLIIERQKHGNTRAMVANVGGKSL